MTNTDLDAAVWPTAAIAEHVDHNWPPHLVQRKEELLELFLCVEG